MTWLWVRVLVTLAPAGPERNSMATFAPVAPASFRQPLCPTNPTVRPFSFYTQPANAAVLLRNGHYVRAYAPRWEEVDALEEGVTYFSEGRVYTVDAPTEAALTADGFGDYIS